MNEELENKCLSLAVYERRRFFQLWNRLEREETYFENPLEKFLSCLDEWKFFKKYKLENSFKFFSFFHPDYPKLFRHLPQPPIGIFVWGEMIPGKRVAVVGSRKPSVYSLRMTRRAVRVWISAGYQIVSGGALGIDGEAHRAALDFEGQTIAILGGGFKHLYPSYNIQMLKAISSRKGCSLLSEYPPEESPQNYYFPERNRLIATLGDQLFLAQAHEKSGSLSTARSALEMGKDIFVLRPPAGDPSFNGSQNLIDAGALSLSDPQQLRLNEGLLGLSP